MVDPTDLGVEEASNAALLLDRRFGERETLDVPLEKVGYAHAVLDGIDMTLDEATLYDVTKKTRLHAEASKYSD
ncbi:hypothetical protein ADK58_04380 [Streptomyces sp. XY152]|nr:hypothetical protein ADK58_04380 [Streptomyces sp. XY152]